MLRNILVPVDLSPATDRVLGRLARLPLNDGVKITLLHVIPENIPVETRRRAHEDAKHALASDLEMLHELLPMRAKVRTVIATGAPASEIGRHAAALDIDLVVMGRGGGRGLRDAFLGSTAERVIRQSRYPVLVARRRPRTAYRHPALALGLDEAAHQVLEVMLDVIPPPRPTISVVHAYDAPFEGLVYPSLSASDAAGFREHYRRKALKEIETYEALALARAGIAEDEAPVFKNHVRHGSPRSVITKEVRNISADLLVLGTHGYSGLTHAFIGTVAGDVLRDVSCDVLIVPPAEKRKAAH